MKTILIPTNFSSASENALKEGLSLLRATGVEGRILLLNTYILPSSSPHQLVSLHDKLKEESMKKLEEEMNRVRKEIASDKIFFELLSRMGSLENIISHLIDERRIDYVVLGLNGYPNGELSKILYRVHCPALIVPYHSSPSKNLAD